MKYNPSKIPLKYDLQFCNRPRCIDISYSNKSEHIGIFEQIIRTAFASQTQTNFKSDILFKCMEYNICDYVCKQISYFW